MRILTVLPLIMLLFLMSSCAEKNSIYPPSKREEMTRRSKLVVEANYKSRMKLKNLQDIDAAEGREGFSQKMENGVTFRILKSLKGSYGSNEITVGVAMPAMAFGMSPNEFAGEKNYTLYFIEDRQQNRLVLIGAEWQKRF